MMHKQKGRSRSIRFLIMGALLLLVLISGNAIFAAKIKGRGDGTPSRVSNVTVTPTKTSTTPVESPSATPSPTATALSTPPPLFSEAFLDNHNGWAILNSSAYTRTIADDTLTLSVIEHKILIETIPSSSNWSNFGFSITYTLENMDKNDKMGVYLRGDSNLDHDYRIDILGNNTLSINKEYLDDQKMPQSIELSRMTKIPSLRPIGQENTLDVEMNGSQMILKVNGLEVKKLLDVDYTKGQAALFVENGWTSHEATASFSSIEVNPLLTPFVDATSTATPQNTQPTSTSTPKK